MTFLPTRLDDVVELVHRDGCYLEAQPHVHRIHLLEPEAPRDKVGRLPLVPTETRTEIVRPVVSRIHR